MAGRSSDFFEVSEHDQVATILVADSASREGARGKGGSVHWVFAQLLNELRTDNAIRVIVLTGAKDGEFWVPPLTAAREAPHSRAHHANTSSLWRTFTGVNIAHQAMVEIEKPIVARVNGDAVGTGASVLFNCDLSVAVEDALIADHHLAMGELPKWAAGFGMVPGDGGLALAPLHMPPMKMKEFLMLARPYRASEFAEAGIINYAVPRDELDQKVAELVGRLLARPAYALAWTKRVANRQTVAHMNMTADAASAYELVNMLTHELLDEGQKPTLE